MDNKFTYIKERILNIAEFKGVSKEKFINDIGMTYANFKGENKKKPLNSDTIVNIVTMHPEINLRWLLTGTGNMTETIDKIVTGDLEIYKSDSLQSIPLLPIEAFAGYGKGDIQSLEQEGERYLIPLFKGAEFLLTVRGSSMYPKYNSGDLVACKRMPLDTFFQWNKVYALDTMQGALIKKIKKGSDKDHVLIVSENPNYEPFELHLSEIRSIALVMGVLRLE